MHDPTDRAPAEAGELECSECGKPAENVAEGRVVWTAWGRSCSDFRWARHTDYEAVLCYDDMIESWEICDDCGALVEGDHCGKGYTPEDYDDVPICPECAARRGYAPEVPIERARTERTET